MAEEGSSIRVVRNTLANGLGAAISVGVSILLTPFMIRQLGVQAYGAWALALTLTFFGGYAAFTDLGVEGAAVRYVAEARSRGDAEGVNRTVSTALAFFTGIALLLTPVLVALAFWLPGVFGIGAPYQQAATYCFLFLALQLMFDLPARALFAGLEGAQHFTAYQAVLLLRSLLQTVLFIGVLVANLGIGSLGAASLVSSGVMLLTLAVVTPRMIPGLRVSPRYLSRETLRHLFGFGGGLFGLRVIGTIYRQMDRIIIGVAVGASAVTVYEVANQLHLAAALVQSVAVSALMPATAYLRAQRSLLRDMYLRGSCWVVGLATPVTIAGILFAEPLIRTWIGPRLIDAAGPARVLLVYLTFTVFLAVGTTMVVALGHLRFLVAVAAVNLGINFVLSVVLVHPFEVNGVVIGTLVAQAVSFPPTLWYVSRTLDVELTRWFRGVVLPVVPGVVTQLVTAAPLLYAAERADRLPEVLALATLSAGLGILGFLTVGLRGAERRLLLDTLRGSVGIASRARPAES
jgi:O-antigen/teichoic acid export membrane protein